MREGTQRTSGFATFYSMEFRKLRIYQQPGVQGRMTKKQETKQLIRLIRTKHSGVVAGKSAAAGIPSRVLVQKWATLDENLTPSTAEDMSA